MNQVSPSLIEIPEEIDEDIFILELVRGRVPEGKFWAYMKMKPSTYERYRNEIADNNMFNLEEYGEVVAKGWGHEPPAEIRLKMQEEYNADENLAEKMIAAMKRAEGTSE